MVTPVSFKDLTPHRDAFLNRLQDNLGEIIEAAKQNGFEIVGDTDGYSVYYKHRFWGQVHDLTKFFYSDHTRIKFAQRSFRYTYNDLILASFRLANYLKVYGNCLDQKLLTDKDRETVENVITKYNNATQSFYYFSKHLPVQFQKISEYWKKAHLDYCIPYEVWKTCCNPKYLMNEQEYQEYHRSYWSEPSRHLKDQMRIEIHEKSMHYQNIIDLERRLRNRLPVKLLKIFSDSTKQPYLEDILTFRKWIIEIDQNNKITQELFLNGMRSLCAHMNKFDIKMSRYAFVILKVNLIAQNCNLLKQSDVKQLHWRSNLIRSSTVTCNEKTFTIDQRISPVFFMGNEERVTYSVQENPNIQLLICSNKAWPAYYISLSNKDYPDILEIDDDGKCAIIEKLYPISLKTSQNRKNLGEFFNRLFQGIIDGAKTKANILESMMMTKDGRIKNDLAYNDSEENSKLLNFNMIEDYIVFLANGDITIQVELISVSKLKEGDIAKNYAAVIKHTLEGKSIDMALLPKLRGLDHDREIGARCLHLAQNVKVCKLNFIQYLKKNQIELSHKEINDIILDTYKKLPCISFLPSYFESELIKRVNSETKADKKFLGIF